MDNIRPLFCSQIWVIPELVADANIHIFVKYRVQMMGCVPIFSYLLEVVVNEVVCELVMMSIRFRRPHFERRPGQALLTLGLSRQWVLWGY